MSYPTVAFSDAFNALGHGYAALLVWEAGEHVAATGFALVALAASVGVVRFGCSEAKFQGLNGALAELAGFVGMPLIGLSFANHTRNSDFFSYLVLFNTLLREFPVQLTLGLVVLERLSNTFFPDNLSEFMKILTNLLFFITPCCLFLQSGTFDEKMVTALVLFLVGALLVGAERNRTLCGVRRENIFHYCIGTAAPLFALALVRDSRSLVELLPAQMRSSLEL